MWRFLVSVANFVIFLSPGNKGIFRGKVNNIVLTCNVNVMCRLVSFWK